MCQAGKANATSALSDSRTSQHEEAVERVAQGHAGEPAGQDEREPLGGEDAAHVAPPRPDAAQDADLTRPVEHVHGDRVDEPDEADRDDQEAEDGDRRGDRPVRRGFVALRDVGDLGAGRIAVDEQRVLDPGGHPIDRGVVGGDRPHPVVGRRGGATGERAGGGERHEQHRALFLLVVGDADHAQRHRPGRGRHARRVAQARASGACEVAFDYGDAGRRALLARAVPAAVGHAVAEHGVGGHSPRERVLAT